MDKFTSFLVTLVLLVLYLRFSWDFYDGFNSLQLLLCKYAGFVICYRKLYSKYVLNNLICISQEPHYKDRASTEMPLSTILWFWQSLREKEKTRETQKHMEQLLIVILSLEILRAQGSSMTIILQGWRKTKPAS